MKKQDIILLCTKIGGILLSIGGLILTNKAAEIQQNIAIKDAVEEYENNKLGSSH